MDKEGDNAVTVSVFSVTLRRAQGDGHGEPVVTILTQTLITDTYFLPFVF